MRQMMAKATPNNICGNLAPEWKPLRRVPVGRAFFYGATFGLHVEFCRRCRYTTAKGNTGGLRCSYG